MVIWEKACVRVTGGGAVGEGLSARPVVVQGSRDDSAARTEEEGGTR